MKKIFYKLLILTVGINFLVGCSESKEYIEVNELIELKNEEISDKLIRFHVLANSDSEEDQNLKLKVRDAVIEEMYSSLGDSNSLEESRKILLESSEEIIRIAKEVIAEEGFNYDIDVELGKTNFPDKAYGDYIFKQGEYEAFKILIGEAEGENWWCVMFPPLCFVDESKKIIDSDKLNSEIIKSEEETLELDEEKNEDIEISEEKEIKFSFKIIEFFKELFS